MLGLPSANAWYATCSPSTESQGVEKRSVGCQTVNKIFFSNQPWAWSVVGFVGMCFCMYIGLCGKHLKKVLSVCVVPAPNYVPEVGQGGICKAGHI